MNRNAVADSSTALQALLASLACLCGQARAQSPLAPPPASAPASAPDENTWRFTLGLGAISSPSFPGSDRNKTRALPLLGASYGRWFIGGGPESGGEGLGVGATLYRDGNWQVSTGLSLGLGKAREESDDVRLTGLGNIDGTTRGALSARYGAGWFGVRASVSTDIGGNQQGTQAGIDLEGRLRLASGLMLSAGPGLRWGDQRYTQTFYGIGAAQAAASGRAEYRAGACLTDWRFTVGANYPFTPQIGVGARLTASRLREDAASSPLVFDDSPLSFGLFGSYRF